MILYCWSCSQCQLSCCITLFTVFAEPMVSKARAKKLEENSKSCRNFRHIYSLLGAPSSHSSRHNLTQNNHTQPFRAFTGETYIYFQNKSSTWSREYLLMHIIKPFLYNRGACLPSALPPKKTSLQGPPVQQGELCLISCYNL